MWKNCVFWAFARRSSKRLGNSVLSRFSRHFVQSSQKMLKTAYLSFLRDVPQLVWEKSFSRFSRRFVQSSQKMRKNGVFWAFCAKFRQKYEKTAFFHVFRDTLYIVRRKCENQRFLSFLRDVPQKVWENSFFWDTLNKVRKKCEKTTFLSFCAN